MRAAATCERQSSLLSHVVVADKFDLDRFDLIGGDLKAKISLPFITADASGPKHIEESLSRAKFEQLASKLITRCRHVWAKGW